MGHSLFSLFADIFTIFAANFNAMKLTKDQKNLLKGGFSAWAGMIVALVLFAVFGKRTWSDTLWLVLGMTIAEVIVGMFLTLGSRVPKKNNENQ